MFRESKNIHSNDKDNFCYYTLYFLSLFSFAKSMQSVLEISTTYRWVSYLLAGNQLICRLGVQCMIFKSNVKLCSVRRCVCRCFMQGSQRDLKQWRRTTAVKTSLKKWICVLSNFIASIWNPLYSSNVGDFSWSWTLKGFIHVQIEKGKIVVLCPRPPSNVALGVVTS